MVLWSMFYGLLGPDCYHGGCFHWCSIGQPSLPSIEYVSTDILFHGSAYTLHWAFLKVLRMHSMSSQDVGILISMRCMQLPGSRQCAIMMCATCVF